jgi:hypothetical protein
LLKNGSKKHAVFQKLDYAAFTPACEALSGSRVVSRSGVVFDWSWIWRTVYRNPLVVLKTIAISLASLAGRGLGRVDPQTQFGIIHSIWTNGYYHWLTESLPRALVMKREFPETIPLLPIGSNYHNFAASLECLGFERVEFFPRGRNVLVRDPVVTSCPLAFATTDPALLREVRQKVSDFLIPFPPHAATRMVYVSRAKARGRRVANEAEVIEVMRGFGVEIINFEDFDFFEQVRIMSQTKILVSIHGAGLTNMMFMPEGGKVVEIVPSLNGIVDYCFVRNSVHQNPCYVQLANAMQHEYFHLQGRPRVRFYQKTHMADVWINPDQLHALMLSLI